MYTDQKGGDDMKTMTCKQLGGACDVTFEAETFDEIAELSKKHGMDMAAQNDEAHMVAMKSMQDKMQNPEEMQKWMQSKREEFEAM